MTTRFVLVTGHTFGRRALDGLLSSPAAIEGRLACSLVVGLDERRREETSGYAAANEAADYWSVPYLSTMDGSLLSDAPGILAAKPHYLLVIGWSRIVSPLVLDIPGNVCAGSSRNAPDHGCIGMHPTKLPTGRGQAPIPWTILKGLEETALTTFFLEETAASGLIIRQETLVVRPAETSASLFARFADLHYQAGARLAEGLANRRLTGLPQDEALATVWPRRRPADGLITASMPSGRVIRLVRALTGPYPRAFVRVGGLSLRVVRARLIGDGGTLRGTIGAVGAGTFKAGMADGTVEFTVDQRDATMLAWIHPGMRMETNQAARL